jgi:hypothetical protein
MSGLESKSFNTPDEERPFADKGAAQLVNLGGSSVLRGRFEPGWRWSEHVRPVVGTDSCESPHFMYVISGRMHVRMNDGAEGEVGPGDLALIQPGHDAWVIGDEACVAVDFGASPAYAQPSQKEDAAQA